MPAFEIFFGHTETTRLTAKVTIDAPSPEDAAREALAQYRAAPSFDQLPENWTDTHVQFEDESFDFEMEQLTRVPIVIDDV